MSGTVEVADAQGNIQHVPVDPQYAVGRSGGADGDDTKLKARLRTGEAGRTAAAVAAGNILASFLGDGATSAQAQEKAAELITEIGENLQSTEYAPEPIAPASQPVTRTDSGLHVVQQPEPVAEVPTDYEIPADLAALLEEDEPEAVAEIEEPEPVAPAALPEFDDDDLLDPRVQQVLAENERLRKKAESEQKLRVKTSRPTWEQEAKRVFRLGDVPLVDDEDLASIKADSKRSFMQQAKALADGRKRFVVRVAPAATSRQEPARDERAEVWGPPPASTPPSDVTSNAQEARLAKARRSGNLSKIIGAMIEGGR